MNTPPQGLIDMTSVEEPRRIVFIGGTYKEFLQLCYERRVPPMRQIYGGEERNILGYCLCENCVEIVYGQTGRIVPELFERIQMYLAIGHIGG